MDPQQPARGAATAAPAVTRAHRGERARWLPTALGILVGLFLCAITLFVARLLSPLSSTPSPAPAAVESAICADLQGQHYDALYGLLAPNLAAQGTEQQFAATQRELDVLDGAVTRCAMTAGTVAEGSATFMVRLTRSSSGMTTAPMTLSAIAGQWKVSAYDTSRI